MKYDKNLHLVFTPGVDTSLHTSVLSNWITSAKYKYKQGPHTEVVRDSFGHTAFVVEMLKHLNASQTFVSKRSFFSSNPYSLMRCAVAIRTQEVSSSC